MNKNGYDKLVFKGETDGALHIVKCGASEKLGAIGNRAATCGAVPLDGYLPDFPNRAADCTACAEVAAVAKRFCEVLREWLGDDMAEVVRRNASPEYADGGLCASHDFCDANMAMAEAYEAVTGRSWDLDVREEVDMAWPMAKSAGFDSAKII